MAVCLNHTDTEAVTRCAACGKPLCEKCVLHADGADYCSEACHRRGVAAGSRSEDVIEKAGRADYYAFLRKLIWFLIILAVLAAAGWFYSQNRKEIDRKVSKITKAVQKEGEKVIQEGKAAVPGDSKYKKDRENLVNE